MKLTNIGVQLLPVIFALSSPVFYGFGSVAFAVACLVLAVITFTMLLNDNGNSSAQ